MIRFSQVENIKSVTLFNSIANALGRMEILSTDHKVGPYDGQGLISEKIWAAFNISQNGHFFEKRKPKFHEPLFNSFSECFAPK